MKKYLFLFATLLLLCTTGKLSAVNDSCLTLIWPNVGDNYNPDWIKKDTCKDSPTYGEWFQAGVWLMSMKEYVFNRLIPKSSSAFIEDIDTIKYKSVKDSFQILENKFGKIRFFRDRNECSNMDDKSFVELPCLDIDFARYNLSKEVLFNLRSQPISRLTYLKRQPQHSDVVDNNINELYLKPNPCTDKLKLVNLNIYTENYTKVIIYNYIGVIMNSFDYPVGTTEFEIDVSSFEDVIYFLIINNKILKFIKLR